MTNLDLQAPILIITPQGEKKEINITEENKYNLMQIIQDSYLDKAAILLHDHENEVYANWRGCLMFHNEMTKEQELIIEQVLSLIPNWNSFYTSNIDKIWPFHGKILYKPTFPSFLLNKELLTYMFHSNICVFSGDSFYSSLDKPEYLDEEVYIKELENVIHNEVYFMSLVEAITYHLEHGNVCLMRDLRNLSKRKIFFPEKTMYLQRSLIYCYLNTFKDVVEAYVLQNKELVKFFSWGSQKALFSDINLSTDPNITRSLRKPL